jgi:hypothetical protein
MVRVAAVDQEGAISATPVWAVGDFSSNWGRRRLSFPPGSLRGQRASSQNFSVEVVAAFQRLWEYNSPAQTRKFLDEVLVTFPREPGI